MSKLKWILLGLLVVFCLIVIFQNLATIEVHLLFMAFQLPQAALLLITLAIGFILGLSMPTVWRVANRRAYSKKTKLTAADSQTPQNSV